MIMVIHLYRAFSVWIIKCALHFSTGYLTRLLMRANNTESCSLQSLKVQVKDASFLDNGNVKWCRHQGWSLPGFVVSLVVLLPPTESD